MFCLQDVAWALYNRKNRQKHPSGSRCWSCATVAAQGFREQSWSQLVSLVKTDEVMAKTFQIAKKVVGGCRDGASWLEEQVFEENSQTFRLQESFTLISESQFEQKHNVKAKHPEVAKLFQHIPGLVGKDAEEKFIIMKEDTPRRLILETSGQLNCQTLVMPGKEQLRPQQGKDLLAFLEQKRPGPKGMTEEAVKKAVEAAEAATKAAASVLEAAPVAAEPAPLASLATDGKKDDDDDSEDIDMVCKPMLPGDHAEASKGKGGKGNSGKGKKGRGGRGTGRGSKRASETSAHGVKKPRLQLSPKKAGGETSMLPSGTYASASATARAASPGAKSKARTSKGSVVVDADGDYQNQQYEKWMQSLSVHDTLAGTSMKTPLYQASRILKGLDEESAEYANLNASIVRVQNAEKLLEGVSKFSIVERNSKLEDVLGGNS
eukprot:6472661-Amphidinium_carterae.1